MSIQKDGFLSYSELLTYERRARELRGEAIRAGVASLFGLNNQPLFGYGFGDDSVAFENLSEVILLHLLMVFHL